MLKLLVVPPQIEFNSTPSNLSHFPEIDRRWNSRTKSNLTPSS